MAAIKVEVTDEHILLHSPYNEDLPALCKSAGGVWDGSVWKFRKVNMPAFMGVLKTQWSILDLSELHDLVNVELTATRTMRSSKASVDYRGRTLANARGRDSGARLGPGVALVSGNVTSGGSTKNWETVIRDGTVLILESMPRAVIQRVLEIPQEKRSWIVRILEADDPKALLKKEREALLARLAEIDKRLSCE